VRGSAEKPLSILADHRCRIAGRRPSRCGITSF
jgi:hypothetical protein